MKVATKLSGALGWLLVVLVVLLIYHVGTIRDTVSTSYELSEISSRLYLSSSRQLGRLGQLEENAAKYAVTRDPGYLEKFEEARDEFDATLADLSAMRLGSAERVELDRLVRAWSEFGPLAERFIAAPDADAELAGLREPLAGLRFLTRRLSDASQAVMAARLASSASTVRHAERVSWSAAAAALLLSILVSAFIVRSISSALRRLQAGTRAVADGDFDHRLSVERDDEFAQLARDFNVMTQRLGELDQLKRDFLSKVSHDLKTPLASIHETTRVLLDEVPGALTPDQRRLLELSQQSGQRLSSMIGNILDLSGMEAGALRLDVRRHELAPIARGAVEPMEPMMLERGLRLRLDPPPRRVWLDCDAERVVQLLTNLLENAIKFSPPGGELGVLLRYCDARPAEVPLERWAALQSAAPGDGAVLIAVADAGPGVPASEREKIFGRFFQTEAGRRVRGRGVGLGLAICREIVAAHGGQLWVDENPGGGSVFCALLPGAELEPAEASPALSLQAQA